MALHGGGGPPRAGRRPAAGRPGQRARRTCCRWGTVVFEGARGRRRALAAGGGARRPPRAVLSTAPSINCCPSSGRIFFAGRDAAASVLHIADASTGSVDAVTFPTTGAQRIRDLFFFQERLHVATVDQDGKAALWQLAGDGGRLIPSPVLGTDSFVDVSQFTVVGERFFFAGATEREWSGIWVSDGGHLNTAGLDRRRRSATTTPSFSPAWATSFISSPRTAGAGAPSTEATARPAAPGGWCWARSLRPRSVLRPPRCFRWRRTAARRYNSPV